MAVLILPKQSLREMIRERKRMGGDRYDEVWDGVYVMSPLADNEHQEIGGQLLFAINDACGDSVGRYFHGCNVSDQPENWRKNFRCPDVAVFLEDNPAEDRKSHWFGGPDFAVEIISKGDRSRKKFGFYAAVNVRELMFVAREPWALELYRREGSSWRRAGESTLRSPTPIESAALGVAFTLVPGPKRPRIEVKSISDGQSWLA